MANQKWKTDASLYNAPTVKEGVQVKKQLQYDTVYRKEFLDSDPLRDWESIERCKWLWEWALEHIEHGGLEHDPTKWSVLDVGTKDAQFPEWLREQSVMALGLEYSEPYVKYAIEKGRPSYYGNACAMPWEDRAFDFVFSHHLHGLLPDYLLGLKEMFRVTDKYMLALNQVPGNPRKHYSYINSSEIFSEFIDSIDFVDFDILYNDYLDTGFNNEWVIFLAKADDYTSDEVTLLETIEEQYPNDDHDVVFKMKKENPFEK
jgi:hypothetical protein